MGKKRKPYPAAFKAKMTHAPVRWEETLAELTSEFGVHGNQVVTWRRQLTDGAAELFENGRPPDDKESGASEQELYEQIGRLKMEAEWRRIDDAVLKDAVLW